MKKHLHFSLFAILITFFLLGCAPRIDASSKESLKGSIERVREQLPEGERSEFDKALLKLSLSQIDLGLIFSDNSERVGDKLKKAVHGKTAKQIIAESKK